MDNKTQCYMQYFMQCKELVRTAGMGDIISVTGMIYHETIAMLSAVPKKLKFVQQRDSILK